MRSQRLADAYLGELIRHAADGRQPETMGKIRADNSMRSILFIADCVWEPDELLPELEKIASVTVADVSGAFKRNGGKRPSSEVLLELVRALPTSIEPDVLLLYARPTMLSTAIFDELRAKWKSPILGLNLDDKAQFFPYHVFKSGDDGYADVCRGFDLNLTSTQAAVDWYSRIGAPCRYMPMGYRLREEFASPPASSEITHGITFLGSRRTERAEFIDKLRKAGVPIQVFGNGWDNSSWIDKPGRIYRQSQLNLGIGFAFSCDSVVSSKARDFECPGSGGCYITTYNWELCSLYEVGREILCYRSVEELVELYSYYIKRPDDCMRIAQAAHRRCSAEHTWEHRFRDLFRELGYKIK